MGRKKDGSGKNTMNQYVTKVASKKKKQYLPNYLKLSDVNTVLTFAYIKQKNTL